MAKKTYAETVTDERSQVVKKMIAAHAVIREALELSERHFPREFGTSLIASACDAVGIAYNEAKELGK